jgi:hypothetical protein
MIKKILYKKWKSSLHPKVREMVNRAACALNQLEPVEDNTSRIIKGDRILMTMGRDENARIPYFLEYYRNLGINHFLFVDNQSTIPMADLLCGQKDVSLWRTDQSYLDSKYGVDWMNALLSKYAVDHWALTVDLDEFFVYPNMETRSYDDLLCFLEDIDKPSLFCMLVDMYPKDSIFSARVPIGEAPLKYASYFDKHGYYQIKSSHEDTWVRGGPRMRAFNSNQVRSAPALNKTPLIKWSRRYAYYLSTHVAYPKRLNHAHRKYHEPTGALLHFKFVSGFHEKMDQAIKLKNHYNNSQEYQKYLDRIQDNENYTLYCSVSKRYKSTESLLEANLITAGCWK